MAMKTKPKPAPKTPTEPRPVSAELQAGIDKFTKALGHILLVKIDPEAARRMSEDTASPLALKPLKD
jgi:hypothetical protein